MSRVKYAAIAAATLGLALVPVASSQQGRGNRNGQPGKPDRIIEQNANAMLEEGRPVFRFETFGDQAFWGDSLKLHQAIEGSKLGGAGAGVSPATALSVGLKVDADALPGSHGIAGFHYLQTRGAALLSTRNPGADHTLRG